MYPKEKKIKNFIALVGVASAGAFLCFPALALISSSGSGSNQSLNNHAQAESTLNTRKLLAQSMPGDSVSPPPVVAEPISPTPVPETTTSPTPVPETTTSPTPIPEATTSPTPAPQTQNYRTSGPLEPGTWLCLNNPNPVCRGTR
ncbi:MAG: hypothetical protein KME08_09615 [Aphanothece sp. CMT-3BRIN-NPC111]|jgi:cell division septation protein DedD|nr:hypothetical protein [Aphanothece sp. CMT-3BRIN-NPC111]